MREKGFQKADDGRPAPVKIYLIVADKRLFYKLVRLRAGVYVRLQGKRETLVKLDPR